MNNYVVVLGSNLPSEFGNSDETLKKCVNDIRSYRAIKSVVESKWYSSLSFLDEREPRYVNVGIELNTNLKPVELLNFTSGLENKYGRKRQRRWDPRTCDIDILDYKGLNYTLRANKNILLIPHPRPRMRN